MTDPILAAQARARRAFAALFIFLFIVAVVAAFIAWRGDGEDEAAPDPDAATTGPATAPVSDPPNADDGVDETDGAAEGTGPEWIDVNGLTLPVIEGAGPASVDGGLASGFGQCGSGAALAAVHLFVRSLPEARPDVFEPTIAGQFTGEDRDALAEAVDQGYTELLADTGGQIGPHDAGPVAVRIDYATDTSASVRLLLEETGGTSTPARAQLIVTTAWIDGDWRLVAPAGGSWESGLSSYSGNGEGFTYLADLEACDGH